MQEKQTITKSYVCGVTCHKGDANCNGYCLDESVPAPATYEVPAQTFGEKAVGLFNPSGDDAVTFCKKEFAAVLDTLNVIRGSSESSEVKRMASIAITEAQTAQMWAVKALTWKD